MKFSVAIPTGYEGLVHPVPFATPDDIIRIARRAEELGYDSVWGNDHLTTQHYVRELWGRAPNFWDVLVMLTAVAAHTTRLRLGTSVLVVPMREPVVTVKQIATLDCVSHGRAVIGVGIGAYKEEFEAVRSAWRGANRGEILDEGLEAYHLLLTEPSASFKGRYFHFEGVENFPKPVQDPFPIYVGGHNLKSIDRAVRWGYGWCPGWRPLDELAEWTALLKHKAEQAGRDPASIEIAPQFSATVARTHEEACERYLNTGMVHHRRSLATSTGRDASKALDNNLIGSPAAILEKLGRLEKIGVDHCSATMLPTASVDEMLEQMEFLATEVFQPFNAVRRS